MSAAVFSCREHELLLGPRFSYVCCLAPSAQRYDPQVLSTSRPVIQHGVLQRAIALRQWLSSYSTSV